MSSDPNRPRPRSSKKRRAVQSGAARPASGVRRLARRNSPPPRTGGLSTPMLALIAVIVFGIGVALAGGVIKFGSGATPRASAAAVARGTNCPTSAPPEAPAGQTRVVTIETAKGTIEINVDPALGPKAAGNFIALASCGFYDGIVFHRLVPGFVIQGGDPQGNGQGGPGYEFADDPVTVAYARGIVAMANSGPNSNGSQFFIVLADNTTLTPNYSIFGRVTNGMDVVDAIAAMPNGGGQENAAVDPVAMTKVTIGPPVVTSPAAGSPVAPSTSPAPS